MNSKQPQKLKLIVLGVGLLLAIKLSLNIWRLWKTGDKVTQAQAQLEQVKREQEELRSKLAYAQSPEFVEREAREKLGYGREGEIIVILPELEASSNQSTTISESPPWRQWWDLYVGI